MSAAGTRAVTGPRNPGRAHGPDRDGPGPRPARPRLRERFTGAGLPYLLLLPVVLMLLAVLGYPTVRLLVLAFQDYGVKQLWSGTAGEWVGFANFTDTLGDGFFWEVVARTTVFTIACVTLSIGLGLLIALLMRRISTWVRVLLTVSLVLTWSMPQLVASTIFVWMFDTDWGVMNWLLSTLPGVDFDQHNWFADPVQGFAVIVAVVVWGAIPFIAITLYAALTQVPKELEEAAWVDGASGLRVFFNVTLPVIKPVLLMVTTLSIIWDFGVFNQVWAMRDQEPTEEYYLMSVYSFQKAFTDNDYGLGAAIALLTMVMLLGASIAYLRQMLKTGEVE